ncbi:DNA-directed DNA polymerase alpha subunit pol12 [Allomyces arbusculus]|nr:DNA-directed DNA polymerase alpha subunit pol12 [Allomyces arbusculus]
MSANITEHDVRSVFGDELSEDVVSECVHIGSMYHVSAEDLFTKWEVYAVNRNLSSDDVMTRDHLDDLRRAIQAEFTKKTVAARHDHHRVSEPSAASALRPLRATPASTAMFTVPTSTARNVYDKDSLMKLSTQMSQSMSSQALSSQVSRPASATPSQGAKYADRPNRGKVEVSFNTHLPSCLTAPSLGSMELGNGSSSALALIPNQNVEPFKYMYDKILELGEQMDDYLDVFEERFRTAYPEIDELSNPSYPSQSPVYVVGRIVVAEEGRKLTPNALVIECSRKFNGVRTPLFLDSALPSDSLFPGQVVAMHGTNPAGMTFHVHRILHLPLLDPPTTRARDLLQLAPVQSNTPQFMLVAAGPYTTTDNLLYEPIADLASLIRTHRPHVVLLLGPFIDDRHPLLIRGDVDVFPDDLFRDRVLDPLVAAAADAGGTSELVLVPSVHDLHHEYVTFPQPPLPVSNGVNVRMLPNPVQFTWHELVVGVGTRDALFDVAAAELVTAPPAHGNDDRVARAARNVLEQRSFYPLNPPPENTAPVDLARAAQLELQVTPDLLIMPSLLRHCVKALPTTDATATADTDAATLLVNPGQVARGASGGTVAWITVHPYASAFLRELVAQAEADGDEAAEYTYHGVHQRARVEIVRI